MPLYLSKLAAGSLRDAVCGVVLNRDAPLFNEGRIIVEQELREPRVYFAILEQLAGGGMAAGEIGDRISLESKAVNKYLLSLDSMRLVSKHVPFAAEVAEVIADHISPATRQLCTPSPIARHTSPLSTSPGP